MKHAALSSKTSAVRALTTLAIVGISGASLVSCSTASGGGSDTTLTIGINGGAAMKSIIKTFEDENPGVTIEIKDSPESYTQVTSTQLTGGNAPDIIQIFPGSGGNLSAAVAGDKGYYADLSDEGWASDVPESARPLVSNSEGQLVGVPMTFSSIAGIYNVGVMEELGLKAPTTWPEVLQFCADATAQGKVAYGLGLSDTWTTQLIPYALTATLVYADDPDFTQQQKEGEATFSDSNWRQAMEQYVEMEDAGCFNPSPAGTPFAQVQTAIAQGSTLATVSVAAVTANIAAEGAADLKLEYQAFPATGDAEDTFLSATVGPTFAVNSKTKNQDLARKFVAWLAEPETQVAYATAYGDTAAMPGDLTQESQIVQTVTGFVKDDKVAAWPDQLWPAPTVQQAVFDGVQGIFSGQSTIDDLLSNMDSTFEDAL